MKVASKQILYHGTNAKNLKKILSQGLIARPKKRSWQDDPDASFNQMSRKSFPGVYLTNNLLTARGSVREAMKPGIIVVAKVETKSLIPDEDDLTFRFRGAFDSNFPEEGMLLTEYSIVNAYIEAVKNRDKRFKRVADRFLDVMFRESEGIRAISKKAIREAVTPLVVDLTKAYAIRQMAFKKDQDEKWKEDAGYGTSTSYAHIRDLESEGMSYDDIPSASKAESGFRDILDVLTHKLKRFAEGTEKGDRFNYTARRVGDIGYSGKNRIVAVVGYTPTSSSERVLTVYYVKDRSALAKLFKDWKKTTGNFEVEYVGGGKMRKKVARLKDKDILPTPKREPEIRPPRKKKRFRKTRDTSRRTDRDRRDELDPDIHNDKDLKARVAVAEQEIVVVTKKELGSGQYSDRLVAPIGLADAEFIKKDIARLDGLKSDGVRVIDDKIDRGSRRGDRMIRIMFGDKRDEGKLLDLMKRANYNAISARDWKKLRIARIASHVVGD